MATCTFDPPDYLYEYRKKVFKAEDLVNQLRKEIAFPDSISELDQDQIHSKYIEIIEKTDQLRKALENYDELLYELKKKFETYLGADPKIY